MGQSKITAAKVLYEAFLVLKDAGGELPGRDVVTQIEKRIGFSERETARYEKTGYIRWQSLLHFFSIDAIKTGFLIKRKGVWILTEEGEKAIALGAEKLLAKANEGYKIWKDAQQKQETSSEEDIDLVVENNSTQIHKADINQLEERALEGLKEYVVRKNPYEFQDLVGALLRAMGYSTPYISPKGKDGGIDIIAYKDPLGAIPPRIKVQVKHRPDASISIDEVQRLTGLLNKDGDIGIVVTSGRFTSEAEREARKSHIHIELIDFDRFIELRKASYDKLTDEEKNMLPLYPIYFLGSNE